MSLKRFSGLSLAVLLLAACTATRPPAYQQIDASSIIPGEEVTVARNENVYTIARKNNVRMAEIIALNNLSSPFTLRAGQRLVLPARKGGDSDGDYAPVPASSPAGRIEAAPVGSSIIGGAVQSQPLEPPAPVAKKTTETGPSFVKTPFGTGPSVPDPAPVAATSVSAPAPAPSGASAPAPVAEASSSEPAVAGQFIWPVQGTIVSGFGSKNGTNNDGINIAAPKGAPVVASAGGIVAYTGNEMKGFGNLILVRHEGGWVTAYSHLERMAVAKDSVVAPGDMIGTVGTTGGIASPQLHFEARKEGTPVDPLTVLKK